MTTTPLPDALAIAERLSRYKLSSGYAWHCHKAAAELCRQHEALARKDALLRQCLEAFETDEFMKKLNAASEIRKELAK